MNWAKINKIYCLGIGGIGVSGLARLLNWQGKKVYGSDLTASVLTRELENEGIKVFIGQRAKQVPADADLYIYSDAVPQDNPERRKIAELGLTDKELSYFEAVGELMKEYEMPIAVSGTHGKTTTTAMLAMAMVEAGLDPTVIVGSQVKQLSGNARLGKDKKYFLVEACEHQEHMMKLCPKAIILTNIEEDHLDYYRDLEHIEITFQKYINRLPIDQGLLVKNEDDSESRNLGFDGRIVTYGLEQRAMVKARNIRIEKQQQFFEVGATKYSLQVPGKFNIYNALAVITYLTKGLAVPEEKISQALSKFSGSWRRFEIVGRYKGATIISDYAHHPTAIQGLIKATREFFPGQRIFIVFQPHQHSRTKKLFDKFTNSFAEADFIVLEEIYEVAGREKEEDQDVSSQDLVRAIEKKGKYVFYASQRAKTIELVREHLESNDILLIVGAGDIYQLAEQLAKR